MNRRQKIIVSVTGIFIVLLLLVGLTYAYFLTQVTGNKNDKSISVSTANLALVYGDGNNAITANNILPGTTLDEKTFTVTNQGNATTDYVVVIDNVSVVYAETRTVNGVTQTKGAATEFESNDFVYTLTCTNKDGSDCTNQIKSEQVFPIKGGVVVSNSIEVEGVQSYTLTVTYRETGVDQSADMNKMLNARVNIKDISVDNPYKSDTTLLAYNILNNAMSVTETQKESGYAELVSNTKTKVASEESSFKYVKNADPTSFTSSRSNATNYYIAYASDYSIGTDGKFILGTADSPATIMTSKYSNSTELSNTLAGKYAYWSTSTITQDTIKSLRSLYKISTSASDITTTIKYASLTQGYEGTESSMAATADEYGTSYYYRGAVKNNYLEFNGMCWRIVRIEGDGSIKITLAAQKACSQITAEDTGSAFIGTGDYGYKGDYPYYADYENSTNKTSSMKYKFGKFLNGGDITDSNGDTITYTAWSATNLGKLKSEEVCIGDTESAYTSAGVLMTEAEKQAAISNYEMIYYKNYIRLYTDQIATLMCDTSGNKTTSAKIYPLTADEVVFAGGKVGANNYTYYLRDNATSGYWWTLSPSNFFIDLGNAFYVNAHGDVSLGYLVNDDNGSLRPAVSLASGAKISTGDGTKDSPYTIQ